MLYVKARTTQELEEIDATEMELRSKLEEVQQRKVRAMRRLLKLDDVICYFAQLVVGY